MQIWIKTRKEKSWYNATRYEDVALMLKPYMEIQFHHFNWFTLICPKNQLNESSLSKQFQ